MFASWAGMVDCEGRWWHQKSTYLLCSSGLALAGTWTLQNFWGCCSGCTCLHHGLAWLSVSAVDDTKNHLTYFVRVDWHLPGRELSRMSEVAVVFAHVCIMGWHSWLWGPLMTPKITLPTLFELTGPCPDMNSPECPTSLFFAEWVGSFVDRVLMCCNAIRCLQQKPHWLSCPNDSCLSGFRTMDISSAHWQTNHDFLFRERSVIYVY